ncbi:uncharacterized protein LOC143040770 isoform X3 [Oratosquilla oratoria]|uniref:uncharacterized protein LOC143040770 isoform X3 n=1 Tax=Oratosquilla oratoria TaxID=337810 RepID=UPI003F762A3C
MQTEGNVQYLNHHTGCVSSCAFHPQILATSVSRRLSVIDTERGETVVGYDNCACATGDRTPIATHPMVPDMVACVTVNGKGITLFDLRMPLPLDFIYDIHNGIIRDVVFLDGSWPWGGPGEATILTGSSEGLMKVFALGGRALHTFTPPHPVSCIAPSPEKYGATRGQGFHSVIVAGGDLISSYSPEASIGSEEVLKPNGGSVWRLRYTKSGSVLYACGEGAFDQEEEEMQPDLSNEQQAASLPTTTPTDMLSLVKWIEETRLAEDERRRREDQARFEALLKLINPERQPAHSPQEDHPAASDDSRHRQPPLPPPTQKANAQTPPPLKPDATYQLFREWKRRWQDYATMVDLHSLPHEKQLIQLRMCLTLETQRVLEHTLQIPPSTDKTVDEVVAPLEVHIKGLRNEAIRRRGLLSCRQMEGETFADFYVRLRRSAEEIDICPGKSPICEETQLKSVIIMGVRDDELIQRLISLDDKCSLQDVVNTCRSYETARCATSDIRAQPAQVRSLTHHQRRKKQKSFLRQTPKQPTSKVTDPCQCCARHHEPGACPAAQATGRNCGRQGHFPSTIKCPASKTQCRLCSRIGHFDTYCKQETRQKHKRGVLVSGGGRVSEHPPTPQPSCRRVMSPSPSPAVPQHVSVLITHGGKSSYLQMIPDIGADITVIGPQHLRNLSISTRTLHASPQTTTHTADGSEMTPALGTLTATLTLRKRSCSAQIRVHKDIQTPLLSFSHCKALAIIPKEFPKPILEVKHVKKCVELPFSASTPPSDVKEYFLKEFKDVLVAKALQSTPLKPMVGSPMRIHLKDNAVPFAIHTPRQIPLAFRDHVKDELESMVSQGIIRPAGDEPSEWCHPLIAVAKPNGGVRITTDLSKLNAQVARPPHPSPTPFDAVRSVPTSDRYFTTMDALCRYWQIELAEEDRHLTTFITPHGRFQYCRGPMGFAATGDAHCLRGDIALQGVKNCVKVVDDILLYDADYTTHLTHIHQVLTRCREFGITINKEKFEVAAPKVDFCGFTLSVAGIAADQDKVIAIRDFPTPANLTDLRSFMGLVNQLAEFTPEISAAAQPLRPLMSPKRQFLWTPDHDEAFRRVKAALIDPPVLASFDPTLPTILQTDASRLNGIGFALLQDHGSGRLRLIQCGSRFLTEAETRYATIELELLVAVWAMFKCKYYLMGLQNFTLMTDHRPLVPILNSYTLDAVENPRLQRLKEKVSPYIFTAVWRAGKDLRIPDALSRAPVSYPAPEDHTLCTDSIASLHTIATVRAVTESHVDEDRTLEELRDSARTDPDYVQLHRCVTSGFPSDRYALPRPLFPYWKIRDNLHADGDLVLYGMRIVVPKPFAAASWPVFMIATGAWRRQNAGQVKLSSGQASIRTLQTRSSRVNPASISNLASRRNPYSATTTQQGPSSRSQRTSPLQASHSLSSLTDSPAGLWSSLAKAIRRRPTPSA